MTAEELISAAYDAKPEFVEKTAAVVYALEQRDPVFAEDVKKDIAEITGVAHEKLSAAGPNLRGFGYAIGGSMVAGLGSAMATDMYDAARRGLTKSHNFRAILKDNPELTQRSDMKTLKRSFDTLHRFAPEFTADPHLGGQLLNALAQIPENQVGLVKDLIQSRKNLIEAKHKQYSPGQALDLHEEKTPQKDEAALVGLRHEKAMELEKYKSTLRGGKKS